MARKGLPKKYAKMGFKRGWKAYKASKRRGSRPKARRVYTRPRRRYTRARSNPGRFKRYTKKLGAIVNGFRYVDIISASAQGALTTHGFSREALESMKSRYMSGEGNYATHKGIATGVGYNIIKGKAGVYRGMGKGKILSVIAGFGPEIVALTKVQDPVNNYQEFNSMRHAIHSGYDPGSDTHGFSQPFWEEKAMTVGLIAAQKLVFNTNGPIGLNKYLPKGVNF